MQKYITEYKHSYETWNEKILLQNSDFRQLAEWGDVRKNAGWHVQRFEFYFNEKIFYVQILFKKIFKLVFFYIPGVCFTENSQADEFSKLLFIEHKKHLFKYVRFDLTNELSKIKNSSSSNIKKVYFQRTGSHKLVYNLLISDEEILKKMKPKWRKSFKRSNILNLEYKIIKKPDPNLIYKLGKELQLQKKFGGSHNDKEIKAIFTKFYENIFYIEARDDQNNVLGFRAAIIEKNRAWDFYAVTTKLGRNLFIGYYLLGNMIFELKKRGFKEIIFLGEDPLIKPDIYKHKKNVGADLIAYPGEYEFSNFNLISIIMNLIISLQHNKFTPLFFRRH